MCLNYRPENDSDSDFEEPMSVSGAGSGRGRKRGSGRGGSVSAERSQHVLYSHIEWNNVGIKHKLPVDTEAIATLTLGL